MTDRGAPDLVRTERRTVTTFLPVLAWLPRYDVKPNLSGDVVAGIVLAALLIPESIGYAGIAGVPPEVGLYAAIAAVAAYALTGGTSILVVGPASAAAAVSASVIADVSLGTDTDPVTLTAALAIASGVLLVVAGVLRLGWIVNFISRPVLHAFVAGLSISIMVGQLDSLVGIEFERESAVGRMGEVLLSIPDWGLITAAVGFGGLAILIGLERFAERIPAALVVVALGIILVLVFDPSEDQLDVLGTLPQGLPTPGVPDVSLTTWLELMVGATALVLVGFSEGFAAASAVADRTGERVDGDQELVGSGSANIAAGLFGGMAVSGSLTKSAAAQAAGSRTQVANLVAGLIVVLALLFLAPVFELLPEAIVSVVVIGAVLRAANPRRVLAMWNVNRLDFAAGLATFTIVLVWETLPAMIVGVVLSLAFLVRRASFPHVVEVRRTPDGLYREYTPNTDEETGAHRGADALEDLDGSVAVLRFEASLLYANAVRLERAVHTVREQRPDLRRLVLDAEMIADLDSDGAEMLERIDEQTAQAGIELRLARVHRDARMQMERSGLADRFEGRMFPHVIEALES